MNVKNYQKSLYNDASSFKQNDFKDTKAKNLFQEAEAVFWEVSKISQLTFCNCLKYQSVFNLFSSLIVYITAVVMNLFSIFNFIFNLIKAVELRVAVLGVETSLLSGVVALFFF